MTMQAVILAGGLGTRLRPVVTDRPKPMVRVGDRPFLEYQIHFLKAHQIDHIVLCVGYLHEKIQTYFLDGKSLGLKIDYVVEEQLLGTGGAIKNAREHLDQTFLVLNGDSYLDLDVRAFIQFHKDKKSRDHRCLGTIALTQVADGRDYGSVRLGPERRILAFEEKALKMTGSGQVNAGIYVLERDVLGLIPAGVRTSVEAEVFPSILRSEYRLYGYPDRGFFVDIGTPKGYYRFCDYIEERQR
jgi:D-glycero-alpha-D-manno-heptose 1-phosphate guanylyltransferase